MFQTDRQMNRGREKQSQIHRTLPLVRVSNNLQKNNRNVRILQNTKGINQF